MAPDSHLPGGKKTCIAELQFSRNDSIVVPVEYIHGKTSSNTDLAFDNDPLTYCDLNDWIGIDLGKPETLTRIHYLVRNDANNIFPGEVYELFYFARYGWESCGRQVASSDSLVYANLPTNALFWLRNINTGKEERIFTIENKQMRFW